MTTDNKALIPAEDIPKIISVSKRKAGRPRLNDMNLIELAKHAVIRELRRGNGRVGLAVLEALGVLKPESKPSDLLQVAMSELLPTTNSTTERTGTNELDNVSNIPSKQPRSPAGDSDNTDSSTKFSQSGLTPPLGTDDSAEVKDEEEEK